MSGFDPSSRTSIISYAQKLMGQTLRQACADSFQEQGYQGKGNFGQTLEKFYFGYEPNSNPEPDFKDAQMELKSSPLKTLKRGEIRAKERIVLNIINYQEVHKENFATSTFLKKNAHLLLVFYLYSKEINFLDYLIKLVDGWEYPESDLDIIRRDWELINDKIKQGKAHELSEGDTYYLGACTKGSTALKSLRCQPFNTELAKQRAYSLKQGYVNHIIATLAESDTGAYGKLITEPKGSTQTIEQIVQARFKPFYGLTVDRIVGKLNIKLNRKAKSFFADLTKVILGIKTHQKIEEFEKADIQIKTVRLDENGRPEEHISFPAFEYHNLVNSDWEDSDFKNILESKFFFVFYQYQKDDLVLKKVKLWNMPQVDILEAKKVWDKMVEITESGAIVKELKSTKNGKVIRRTHFPKQTENRVSHVRPHATNSEDTYDLPIKDQLTGVEVYTKHSFWLNRDYVKTEIYLR